MARYPIRTLSGRQSLILLPKALAERYQLKCGRKITLRFGMASCKVLLVCEQRSSAAYIAVTSAVHKRLGLPIELSMELSRKGSELIIGPYVGLLVAKKETDITERKLRRLNVYTRQYDELGGVVFVFALDGVNRKKRTIAGYLYRPVGGWMKCILPYPASIYRRIGFSASWREYFISAIGPNLFNSYYSDKWEVYQWLVQRDLGRWLPYTELFQTPLQVLGLVNRMRTLVIKPTSGMGGKGVSLLRKIDETYELAWREKGDNHTLRFENEAELINHVGTWLSPERYLLQEWIDINNETTQAPLDLRVIMQKDQSGSWCLQQIIGRSGQRGSVVSNISSDGRALAGHDLFALLGLNSWVTIDAWRVALESLALQVCYAFDDTGHNFGVLGLDVAYDKDGRFWLLEANSRDPDASIALDIGDRSLYYRLKSTPMLYAKYLAGFTGVARGRE